MNEGVSVITRGCDDVLSSSGSKTREEIKNESVIGETGEIKDGKLSDVESELNDNEKLSIVKLNEMDNYCNENIDKLCDDNDIISDDTKIMKKNTTRSVSFPSNDNELVTGYLEPANPWEHAQNVKADDVISLYKKSCVHHCTEPIKNIIKQLKKINITVKNLRINELTLKNEELNRFNCEPLEEILKRMQFNKIDLESASLDNESAEILFDMFEYYESVKHLNISNNCNIGARGWQSCAQMLKKTYCLEQLDVRDIVLTQQHMNILKRSLQIVSHLRILKLENCHLNGRALNILTFALGFNTGLKELYLANNNLGKEDGRLLGSMLQVNNCLQLLDVSNNNLEDVGAEKIIIGILSQSNQSTGGLSILIMWNNHLTKDSCERFAKLLDQSTSLETLNIGKNDMSDEFLEICKESLIKNNYLLQLGLQSTGLVLKSVMALAEIIEFNSTLQRIDLRDNHIQLTPLTFLSLALKKNMTITQIDLDDTPVNSKSQPLIEKYAQLVSEIREYCIRNEEPKSIDSTSEDTTTSSPQQRSRLSSCSSRKISLTCQTLPHTSPTMASLASGVMANDLNGRTQLNETSKRTGGRLRSPAPSPIPSPVASPIPSPSRSRFVVSRVTEQTLNNSSTSPIITPPPTFTPSSSSTCFFPTNSRFRVTVIEPTTSTSSSVNSSIDDLIKKPAEEINLNGSLPELNINDKNLENCQLNKSTELNKNDKLIDSVDDVGDLIPKKSQNYTSSLEKLLGLFQNPGNLFTNKFNDKKDLKNPLHSSMNSLIELGGKFNQYLRDGCSTSDDNKNDKLRLTSSESQLCDKIVNDDDVDDKNNDDDDELNKTINDNLLSVSDNLPVNCLNNCVPDEIKSLTIDNCEIKSDNDDDNDNETINNTLNNEINEICDSNCTNFSINLPYSNDNNSQLIKMSDKINVNVNNIDDDDDDNNDDDGSVNSVKSESNDKLIDNSMDINCLNNLPDNFKSNDDDDDDDKLNGEINCGTFDDDINKILSSILDMISFETTTTTTETIKIEANDDKSLINSESEGKIINYDNNNERLINIDNLNEKCEIFDETIIDSKQIVKLNKNDDDDKSEIIDDNYSLTWINNIKSSELTGTTIIGNESCSNCQIVNNDLIDDDDTIKLINDNSDTENNCQLNGTKINNDNDKLIDDNFTDKLILNVTNICDEPICTDKIVFKHNSEITTCFKLNEDIEKSTGNPSSSRDNQDIKINSAIDDLIFTDKNNMDIKLPINIPIINDNDYLSRDTTIDKFIITNNIDDNKLPMEIINLSEDDTNSSNEIVNSTGLK